MPPMLGCFISFAIHRKPLSVNFTNTFRLCICLSLPTFIISFCSEVERLPVVANGKTIACLGDDTRPAELDDIGFNLLNTFSKVTKFYSNTASRILGLNSYELRPRSKSPRLFPKNPWITERALDLPPSRRIPTQLSSLIWRSFLEDNGTIPQPEALRQLIHQSV